MICEYLKQATNLLGYGFSGKLLHNMRNLLDYGFSGRLPHNIRNVFIISVVCNLYYTERINIDRLTYYWPQKNYEQLKYKTSMKMRKL
jgi:hypothetical protein